MSGNEIELVPASPSSGTGSSSNGQRDASGNVQLSEILEREMLASQRPHSARPKIYRVQEMLCAADKGAYHPTYVSFGPYHRGDTATKDMRRSDQQKLQFLRIAVQGGGPPVEEFLRAIESIEDDARSCYDSDVTMERDEFRRMLLLDGIRLITLLEGLGQGTETAAGCDTNAAAAVNHDDYAPAQGHEAAAGGDTNAAAAAANHDDAAPVQSHDNNNDECTLEIHVLSNIVHDLIMLENQIPFFVVKKIYDLLYRNGGAGSTTGKTVDELAWGTIEAITCLEFVPTASSLESLDKDFDHLVHLCHVYLKPSCLQRVSQSVILLNTSSEKYGSFRRATEYYEAGVKFRRWNNGADASSRCSLLDVTFSNGVLRIAHHMVHENTNYILRNVLAFEQRYHGEPAISGATGYVAAYVVFMSQLLSSPEDVALLSRRGVLNHMLGNDAEVCALFRGLAQGLAFNPDDEHYLKPVGLALQRHNRSRLNRWRAWVVRHRFSNPWLAAAWVFGATAVLGTIVQTVLAVLSYVNQGPTHMV